MTDKLTEFLLNGLATDVIVIPTFLLLVWAAYMAYCKAIKNEKE
jgi:hypothetical protein